MPRASVLRNTPMIAIALALTACGDSDGPITAADVCAREGGNCIAVDVGTDPTAAIQTALLTAEPGQTIALPEGRFAISQELSVGVDNVKIVGAGKHLTRLDFASQAAGGGAAGIKAEGVAGITVQDLSILNTDGDGLFIADSTDVIIRNVHVEWENGPDPANGRYGIYPVRCTRVLVEYSSSRGASDAGIYIGESNQVIARYNNAYENVAGIQVENTFDSETYGNVATNNTAGLMIFDLPGKISNFNGGRHLAYNNYITDNNHENFGDPSQFIGNLPAGVGILVMATKNVEVRDNIVDDNGSVSIAVISFFVALEPINDDKYFPYPMTVYVHDNDIRGGGDDIDISSEAGLLLQSLFGTTGVPAVVYDGIITDVTLDANTSPDPVTNPLFICIKNNLKDGEPADWVNMDGETLGLEELNGSLDSFPDLGAVEPVFEDPALACEGPTQARVSLPFAD